MASNKQLLLEESLEFLAMAQKMLTRYQGAVAPASDVSRIQDAAGQATQAAANLNQLVGMLLADNEA